MMRIVSNKRIAKNALGLYVRMFFTMLVGIYTSRVVLRTLGVEDYGIYNVVGGIVAMLSFLNSAMASATSRFLTFELGTGCGKRLNETFCSAFLVHVGISAIIFLFAETIGLWFLINKLVIPYDRMFSAHIVYQFSIFSTIISITQVPYNACLIAHEKFTVFAYIEMLSVTLKLINVYLLMIVPTDKLIFYAGLNFSTQILIAIIYRFYCLNHYPESKFEFIINRKIIRPMLTFSGWDLYGNMTITAQEQGKNFLLNMFFGSIANAAVGISTTVNGMIQGFSYNIYTAFAPSIVKQYANKSWKGFNDILVNSNKYTMLFFQMLSIPFALEAYYVFHIWLGVVPAYAVSFSRLIVFISFVSISLKTLGQGIHATGDIRRISFITGSIYLFSVLITYIVFKLGYSAEWAFYSILASVILASYSNLAILKRQCPYFCVRYFIQKCYMPVILVCVLNLTICGRIHITLHYGFLRFFFICVTSSIMTGILSFLMLSRNKRQLVLHFVNERLNTFYGKKGSQ